MDSTVFVYQERLPPTVVVQVALSVASVPILMLLPLQLVLLAVTVVERVLPSQEHAQGDFFAQIKVLQSNFLQDLTATAAQ